MPHKDPAAKRKYMAEYYLANHTEKRAKIKQAKKDAFARDPEGTRKKWRKYRADGRTRAALREIEEIRARAEAERAAAAAKGYSGTLKPNHF